MTIAQQIEQRMEGFNKMYHAFYDFYVAELKRDDSPFSKYKLHLSTVFFETYLEQTKVTYPIFKEVVSTYDERKATAAAALHDALIAHTLGRLNSQVQAQLFKNDEVLANNFNVLNAKVNKLLSEKSPVAQEQTNAIPQGKHVRKGPKAGKQE